MFAAIILTICSAVLGLVSSAMFATMHHAKETKGDFETFYAVAYFAFAILRLVCAEVAGYLIGAR